MSQSKEKIRQRCLDLMRDISLMERNGEYGHEVWNRAKGTLGRSLAAYRQLGATSGEIIKLGLPGENHG